MSNVEEDIMSEEAFNELIDNFEIVGTLTEYGRKAIKQNVKNLQKRIKELEEKNKLLLSSKVGIDLSYDDYIPKQKVKEIIYTIIDYKIPRATNNGYYYDYFIKQEYKNDFVKLFNKLLEDK